MNLKIKDILKCTGGILLTGNEEYECENFSRDTRVIKKGDTFVAIKGETFDGNTFWKEAFENGADTVIINKIEITEQDIKKYKNKNIIQVYDTIKALQQIATEKRNLYKDLIVVGVTGSVGKTSTKDIIANVLSQKYKTLKTQGNMNNDIGLPFTILNLRDHEVAVIEMGMNHLGEISKLTKIAKPTISVITNVGTSHIGNLGSRENILKAKLEILEGNENPIVIINNDNDLLHDWYEENKENYKIITYGIKNKSNFNAKNIKLNENESEFDCDINGKNEKIKVPVGGEHFVLNGLCAIAVGTYLKIDTDKIIEGISEFELTSKRMDITNLPNGVKVINDAYNASFESMRATLKYLSKFNNRKIAVLGDMFELGEFAKELHEKVGKEVVKNNIDILICNGENSKYIVEQAKKEGMNDKNIFYIEEKEKILDLIKKIIKEGDIILFKASNGMRFFELANKVKEIL